MNEKQWVQHMSGQGEKWEIHKQTKWDTVYEGIRRLPVNGHSHSTEIVFLPKSEYILCDPPEVWEEVAIEMDPIDACHYIDIRVAGRREAYIKLNEGYRIKSLVIEKKVS